MPTSDHAWRPTRRVVLARSAGAACAATANFAPAGGFFAAGTERIRVGLIGCGGRGTGAAKQAAAAHPGVRIVALGDLFADHLAESAKLLHHDCPDQFDCSSERRFVGEHAWQSVLDTDLDAVILAATPWARPLHFSAAIARGVHVYAERPAASDVEGVDAVVAGCDLARTRGLAVMSGLADRYHAPTIETLARIGLGAIGRPRIAVCKALLGLAWHRPAHAAGTPDEFRQRNWIDDRDLSGGPIVERHIEAIDRSLQALGDQSPLSAVPVADGNGSCRSVRYRFADGAQLIAEIARSSTAHPRAEERVTGTAGTADLVAHRIDSRRPWAHDGATANPWQACMSAFIAAIRTGGRGDGGEPLCRSTLVALLGRTALEKGREVAWSEVAGPTANLTAII